MSLLKKAEMPEHLAAVFTGLAATSPALALEMDLAANALVGHTGAERLLRTALWEALKARYAQEVATRPDEGLAVRCARLEALLRKVLRYQRNGVMPEWVTPEIAREAGDLLG